MVLGLNTLLPNTTKKEIKILRRHQTHQKPKTAMP